MNARFAISPVVLIAVVAAAGLLPVGHAAGERVVVRGAGPVLLASRIIPWMPAPPPPPPVTTRPAASATSDTVVTRNGDRLTGVVVGIDPDGTLRMMGPQYAGEVRVAVAALERVALVAKSKSIGGDEVRLTTGDRIRGVVKAVSSKSVAVAVGGGEIVVARSAVKSVAFAGGEQVLVASAFDRGSMTPFGTVRGSWRLVKGGVFGGDTSGRPATLCADLNTKEPITFDVHIQDWGRGSIQCDVMLFAEKKEHQYGHNAVLARLSGSTWYLQSCVNGGCNNVATQSVRQVRDARLRMAFDPRSGQATLWINGAQVGQCMMPNRPTGRYVLFSTRLPSLVRRIRVLKGIVPPKPPAEKGDKEADLIVFDNGDRIAASAVAVADGKLSMKAVYGELTVPTAKVERIVFRTDGRDTPARAKGDVLVEAGGSRFVMTLEGLTGTHVVGSAPHLGAVKLNRDAVETIWFKIPEAPETPPPPPMPMHQWGGRGMILVD